MGVGCGGVLVDIRNVDDVVGGELTTDEIGCGVEDERGIAV